MTEFELGVITGMVIEFTAIALFVVYHYIRVKIEEYKEELEERHGDR